MSEDITDLGHCDVMNYKILIKRGMTPQATEVTFYHELVHAVLFTMGKTDHSEEFVENFGGLLHQFNKTVKDSSDDGDQG